MLPRFGFIIGLWLISSGGLYQALCFVTVRAEKRYTALQALRKAGKRNRIRAALEVRRILAHCVRPGQFAISYMKMSYLVYVVVFQAALLVADGSVAAAHTNLPASPWDPRALAVAPKWTALQRPMSEGIQAISFEGLPFRGKPTRVFAWLGVPKVKVGEKVPAMVLVHGGNGAAFDE
jgi:hypothetical protein